MTARLAHAGDSPGLPHHRGSRGGPAHWRLWVALLGLLWLFILATAPAHARTVLDLDTRAQPVALQDWGDYWIDKTGQLTPAQVADHPSLGWQPTRAGRIYPMTTGEALWIRIRVPPAPDAERWYLEVLDPSVDRASLYTLDSAGDWNEQRAGDLLAVSQWPVPHRHPLLPLAVSAEAPTSYLLRLENAHAISAPLRFVSDGRLGYSEQRVSLILGIFFGLTGLAAVISLLGAVSLRDSAYGWYAPAITLFGLTQASITGLGGMHLWTDWPRLADMATAVLATLATAASVRFVSAAVALAERSRRLHRVMVIISLLGLATAVAVALMPAALRPGVYIPVILLMQSVNLLALAWAWQRGDRFAPWVLLSYLPILATAGWSLAGTADLVPTGPLSLHGLQFGLALHLPIVLVVLMLRSQHRRENTRRIHGLDRIDPATGLINAHVFTERLGRMMARSARLRHESAVMLIDVVNTGQIQRDFGRKAADELPLRVAERLLSTAREIDTAARLSEQRFGMLVEGPVSFEEAAALGPRIVARCLMPYPGLHVDCIAQVRIAYAMVPREGSAAAGLLAKLEACLRAAPLRSKRAVFMLGEGAQPPQVKAPTRPQPTRPQESAAAHEPGASV